LKRVKNPVSSLEELDLALLEVVANRKRKKRRGN